MTRVQQTVQPAQSAPASAGAILQRTCACGQHAGSGGECAACRQKRLGLQRQAVSQTTPDVAPPIVHDVLRSSGQPLDASTRAFMEPRFGRDFSHVASHAPQLMADLAIVPPNDRSEREADQAADSVMRAPAASARAGYDFSQVRVHTGAQAAASARAVNARAYTVGAHMVFGAGQYAPETIAGRRLLAHELTHVVQQSSTAGGQAVALQRDESPAGEEDREEAEEQLSREEEVALSHSTPGEVVGSPRPPVISLYNFAINSAALKERHEQAIAELRRMIRRAGQRNLRIMLVGHADSTGSARVNERLARRRAAQVQRALGRVAGVSITAVGLGADVPTATNDTVEGRSRNRRVDIHLLPASQARPAPPERPPTTEPPPERPPTTEPPPGPPTTEPPPERREDDSWFCAEYPIICASILVGAGAAIGLWYCIRNPLSCLPIPEIPGGDDDEKEEEPEPRACPSVVRLPSGTLEARHFGPIYENQTYMLQADFRMRLVFHNDPSGCACRCGEYLQEVRGFSERIGPDGTVRPGRVRLVGGMMDRTTWREDARGQVESMPYGHRTAPESETDLFIPDRATGCVYQGKDSPGMNGHTPGERMRFHFEFRGAPVDACHGRQRIGGWHNWVVEGDYTVPQPPTPPTTPTPQTQPPTAPRVPSRPQATIGPAPARSGPAPVFCFNNTIGCSTVELLQRRQSEHFMLTEDDVREAIRLETQLLLDNLPFPPDFNIDWAERRRAREQEVRQAARRRVLDFAGLQALYGTGYAD